MGRVCAKKFNQETLNGHGGAQIASLVVGKAWDCRSGLVGKAVHCAAVDNKLPVDTSMVHFFNKPANVGHWNMGIQSAAAYQHLSPDRARLRWFGGAQASVHANYTGEFHPASRQFAENGIDTPKNELMARAERAFSDPQEWRICEYQSSADFFVCALRLLCGI
jgi:hypothetical protein